MSITEELNILQIFQGTCDYWTQLNHEDGHLPSNLNEHYSDESSWTPQVRTPFDPTLFYGRWNF